MSQLFVDNIKNRTGGALGLPDGAVATGVVTSTTFSGNVTGVAATFTGDVVVGGTLNYEDVTNIDSIGIITARSDVSIADSIFHTGDTNTAIRFPAADTFTVETAGSQALRVDSDQIVSVNNPNAIYSSSDNFVVHDSDAGARIGFQRQDTGEVTAGEELGALSFYSNDGDLNPSARILVQADDAHAAGDKPGRIIFQTVPDGSATLTERLRITSSGGIHFNNGELLERAKVTAGKLSDNANIDLENGMVHLFTTAESTTSTPNLRINSSTSVNSVMAIGDTIAVTIITTAAAAGYSAQLTIDGSAVTENWVGGSAPSSGGSSGVDIYNYTIIKTADATFTVVANYTATS